MENFVWRTEVLPLISAHVEHRRAAARRRAAASARHPHVQRGARYLAADRARELRFRTARELRSRPRARRSRETLEARAATRGGRAGRALQSHAGELRSHLRRRIRRGLLQLQVGGSARRRRLRGVRAGRRVRLRDRRRASSTPSWRAAEAWTRWMRSCAFAAASPTCGRCSSKPESPRETRGRRRADAGPGRRVASGFASSSVRAATAYVSDELVLNVYSEQNQQGQRLATLHSGRHRGDARHQRRLHPGSPGRRHHGLGQELLSHDRTSPRPCGSNSSRKSSTGSRATTPALAEAAARSEVERLRARARRQAIANSRTERRAGAALATRAPGARRRTTQLPRTRGAGPHRRRRSPWQPLRSDSGWDMSLWRGASGENSAVSRFTMIAHL